MKNCISVLLLCIIVFVSAITVEEFKHNQGEPSEFPAYKLPTPEMAASDSDSSVLSIFLQQVPGKKFEYEWKGELFVDSLEYFSVTLASKFKNIKLTLEEPSKYSNLKKDEPVIHESTFGWGEASVPSVTYEYKFETDKRGPWMARIHTKQDSELPFDNKAHVGVVIENRSVFKAYSTTTNYKSHVGSKIGLTTRLYAAFNSKSLAPLTKPKSIKFQNSDIDMSLILPNGMNQIVKMKDDGNSADEKVNDGVYGAEIEAQEEGTYVAQVVMRGNNQEGFPFLRTTQHVIEVVSEKFELEKLATGKLVGNEVKFNLKLDKNAKDFVGKKYKAYAEVWDNETPIAWVGGMSLIEKNENNEYFLGLHLNLKWLTHKTSKVQTPNLLKNVYIQHGQKSIHITTSKQMKVVYDNFNEIQKAIPLYKSNNVLTEDMIMGNRPKKYQTKAKGKGKIVLTHGYCAGGNPFTTDKFENFVAFNDPSANRAIDDFALLLKSFIEPHKEGVSFVAHSQGGHATTHLLAYYWSTSDLISTSDNKSLDNSRRIQTVGTPWLGSGLAGSLAELGERLGYGCGNNFDLTRDGSRNWLANLPMAVRKEVYSYITQYGDWSWCSIAVNAVLSWPNDGTSENKYSKLEGGHYQGLTKKQCHTTGMKFPSQNHDSKRNEEMNKKAARD
eukprot:gene5438-9251_t